MVSTKPWSDYKESDYTLEQWHNACIIHQHQGPPTSKSQCKLPIKTPGGAINKNGVHAAAAVLAGARGGVDATPHEKVDAASFLVRIYKQMNEKPPDSIVNVLGHSFLEHHGVKGQKWGIRNKRDKNSKGRSGLTTFNKNPARLSDAELSRRIKRMELEKKYKDLNAPIKSSGKKYAHDLLQNSGKTVVGAVLGGATAFFLQRELKRRFG